MEKQHKIILVYGCPGSGKTTFSKQLSLHFNAQVISGDNVQLLVTTYGQQYVSENLMPLLSKGTDAKVPFSNETWRQSREIIKQHLSQIVKKFGIIVLEDDFLLKSQRKDVRHICQHNQINLVQILMQSSREQCLKNNKMRTSCLPQDVVMDKYEKLEQDDRGIKLKMNERLLNQQLVDRINQMFKIPIQIVHEPLPVEQRTLEITEIEIRKGISDIMKSKQMLNQLFGSPLCDNMKKCSECLSTFKKTFDLTLGAQAFLPSFRIWLKQHQ